jgi:molecular chaperone GrpE
VTDTDPAPEEEVDPAETGPPTAAEEEVAEPLTVEALVEALEVVTAQRDEYLATAQRTQADFENFRKVAQRRLEDEVTRSLGSFVDRLLPVLDACDGALAHGATEVEPIVAALLGALEKEGLVRIDPAGEPFDPAVADAVVHEPGTGGEHVVAEVLRVGYTWQGRVLRPAMVKVTD